MKEIKLSVPLTEDDVRGLNAGDVVSLTGLFYTCRSVFQSKVLGENRIPPVDFEKINLMVHAGPVMKQEQGVWKPVSIDPTSSIRFEKFGPDIIPKLKIRAIVGKSTMGPGTLDVMRDFGCVHLTRVGICGNLLAKRIIKVHEVHNLEEYGKTEATWIMEGRDFGPFIVDMDTKGINYFDELSKNVEEKKLEQLRRFHIQESYSYTEI